MNEIPSPCIAKCKLNDDQICQGCFRHIDEITQWRKASEDTRRVIVENTIERKLTQYARAPEKVS